MTKNHYSSKRNLKYIVYILDLPTKKVQEEKKILAQHYFLVNGVTLSVTVHRQRRAVGIRPYHPEG